MVFFKFRPLNDLDHLFGQTIGVAAGLLARVGFDLNKHVWGSIQKAERFFEGRHGLIFEIDMEPTSPVHACQFINGHIGNPFVSATHFFESGVVVQQEHPVAAHLYVEFNAVHWISQGSPKGGHAVFRCLLTGSAVGDTPGGVSHVASFLFTRFELHDIVRPR